MDIDLTALSDARVQGTADVPVHTKGLLSGIAMLVALLAGGLAVSWRRGTQPG